MPAATLTALPAQDYRTMGKLCSTVARMLTTAAGSWPGRRGPPTCLQTSPFLYPANVPRTLPSCLIKSTEQASH